ncbi:MAG: DNA translocase FtsK, partial [Bacillota bacterium]|nr:DNA translocase FtsK [Bacillota bacterium]
AAATRDMRGEGKAPTPGGSVRGEAKAEPAAAAGGGRPLPAEERPAALETTEGKAPSSHQLKIIDYVKDESLFGGAGSGSGGLGLEAAPAPVPGLGLEGAAGPGGVPATGLGRGGTAGLGPGGMSGLGLGPAAAGAAAAASVGLGLAGAETDAAARARLIGKDAAQGPGGAPGTEPRAAGGGAAAYVMPPIDLLNKTVGDRKGGERSDLKAKAAKLEETLQNFGVNAHVIQVTKGPAVTRYEVQPSVGVKVNSIVRLADDIALNLEARSIRIEAPIPGKAAVGIEVENERVSTVTLREILESREFKTAGSKISFSVGKDISGNAIVGDLKGMPHLLIAGSTGSGKSVCINSIIISLLYKAKPEEVKLVLIDPKVVELSNYNGIPHLLIPVVTEPSKAAAALNWAVGEMTDRYKKFAEEEVRDLASYNETVRANKEEDKVLPQIVIIIDELADLMMAAPSQVEEAICRLAQMARAAGMHLVVATQRPSVDVITGVIKANIPSRIAFAVSSQFDSRTILDMSGAEKLVGKGDMLFNPLGVAKPLRVQGAFVSDGEVHRVLEFVKEQSQGHQYAAEVLTSLDQSQNGGGNHGDSDELLPEAIETVVRAEQASVSMLQRRFRIGYNRAARLIDMMEDRGVIGPPDGSRPRQVLLSLDQWMAINRETEEAKE